MMKFFRKYTKTLLAVFMALLLVVWLGGTALQNWLTRHEDYGSTVVGQAFGHDVYQRDLARVDSQTKVGQRLIRMWDAPWMQMLMALSGGNEQVFRMLQYQARQTGLTLEEWYLLDAEALRSGVRIPAEQIAQFRSGLPPEQLEYVRDQDKLSIDQLDDVIRAYLRVTEAAMQAAASVTVSEADIRDFIRQTAEKVKVDLVVVDPSKLEDPNYQPTPEEIQAQFDKYKDKVPGGPGEYGYELPEAVQVEYIEIRADELARNQLVTEDDAHDYWEAHKAEFKRPVSQPATSSAPATRPEPPKSYETFYEARPLVVQKLQHNKAVKAANRLAEELIRKLQGPWANQPTTKPGDYREPPASEKAPDVYAKLVASLQDKYGQSLVAGQTLMGSSEELTASVLGRASAYAGSPQRVGFTEAAFMVAGLKADKTADSIHARLYRNVYETCAEPLTDSNGNVFIFRNVAVRPAQPPTSVDEVKDQVVKDLRHIRAYAEAERVARSLADRARGDGLKKAFQSDAALAAKLDNAMLEPEPFSRKRMFGYGGMPQLFDNFIPGVGRDTNLINLCFEMGERASATQPTPVSVHEEKDRQRWVVVQFDKLLPVTKDEYNQEREQARQYLTARKRLEFVINWFSHEEIVARAGWQEKNTRQEQPKDAEKDGDKKPSAAGV